MEQKFGSLKLIMKVFYIYNLFFNFLVRQTSIDTTIFWTSLYVYPIFWAIFLIIDLIGLKWMWAIVCLIGLVLSGSNTIGYYKCSGEQKKKVSNFIFSKGAEQITNLFMGGKK